MFFLLFHLVLYHALLLSAHSYFILKVFSTCHKATHFLFNPIDFVRKGLNLTLLFHRSRVVGLFDV